MAIFRSKVDCLEYFKNGIKNKEEIIGYMQKSKNVRYHEGFRDGLETAMKIVKQHIPAWEIKNDPQDEPERSSDA